MKIILGYIFSVLLALSSLTGVYSQEGEEPVTEIERTKGLRIGYDLSRFTLYYFEPERTAYEISLDFELKRNFYPVVEFGWQNIDMEDSTFNYLSDGYYFRIGMDFNLQKNQRADQYEMVFFGMRYGFSKQTHSAENIVITDSYWGDFAAEAVPESAFYGHWIELVGGIRAELFKNFFVGWSVRARILVAKSKNTAMEAYHIPGFGKTENRLGIGFNYSVYYKIPLYKKKYKVLPEGK